LPDSVHSRSCSTSARISVRFDLCIWYNLLHTHNISLNSQRDLSLEDALEVTGHIVLEESDCAKKKKPGDNTGSLSKTSLRRMYPNYSKSVINSLSVVDESIVNYELIGELLKYICTSLEDGAILCFLPGMKEITTAMEGLMKLEYFQDSSNAIIYPLHSSLSNEEQKAIFSRPLAGKRKIVLSTNIGEYCTYDLFTLSFSITSYTFMMNFTALCNSRNEYHY
jgi:hypothetical protein